jgi:hypothetical protein
MEMVLAVPYTHVFLAAVVAFGVPEDVREGRMDWQGYETIVSREVGKDATAVVLQVGEKKTRYEFKGTKLTVTEKRTAPNGRQMTGTGRYDLEKVFGTKDPSAWRTAGELTLKNAKGQVTMRLTRDGKEAKVEQSGGDAPAVFGFPDKTFPSATIRWK